MHIRDPIHGYIEIHDCEKRLINTQVFQRLRGIKQLARADLVYPSLVHTRFEHCIGTMYIANNMGVKIEFNNNDIKLLRIAALLHDIGHGPYSHVFENVLDVGHHEDITKKIIQENDEINKIFKELELDPKDITDIYKNDSIHHEIISSPLDADKIDYLLRDGYHAGVTYGTFDIHRLMLTLCTKKDTEKEYLCIKEKGAENALSFVLARHLMHLQVYQHHVRAITDCMLVRGIELAKKEGVLQQELFDVNNENFLNSFLQYDDRKISDEIISNSTGFARNIFKRLEERKLYKRAYEKSLKEITDNPRRKRLGKLAKDKNQRKEIELKIAKESSIDPENVILYLKSIKNPLSPYRENEDEPSLLIKMDKNGSLKPINEVIPIESREMISRVLYVFSSEEEKNKVGKAAEAVISTF